MKPRLRARLFSIVWKRTNVSEKGVNSNSSTEDSPKNRKFLDSEINQARVVQGFVEEELLWKLQRCLVGESATVCDISSMAERLTKFGLGEISLKRIQGRFFLLEVPDVEYLEVLKQNDWAYLKECFISIEPWSEKRFISERVTWIEVAGIPLHCWNYETFKRVAELWGKLISMGESWNRTVNFEKMEMMISVNKPSLIDELVFMEVGNCKFPIRIIERGMSEWKCEKFLDGRGQLEEKRGESPEVESGIRSESENFSEERRNDMGGALNAISLEEGVIEKVGTGSSAEGIIPVEHFLGNNENISIEGGDIGVEVDRAKEDGVNMGLFSQAGSNVVSGQPLSEGLVAGCTSKSGQHLRSGSNPSESDVEGIDLGGRSVGDSEVRFSMEEEFFQTNRVLSTKEKQKRDRKEKIAKGKENTRCEDLTVNLSLSDSDISNRKRVILREAKKTWEVGKMLGLSVRGDEKEIIDEISRLEGQGLGSVVKRESVKRTCRMSRVSICFIQETKLEVITKDDVRKFWRDVNCEFKFVAAVGRSGGLLIMWDKNEFILSKVWSVDSLLAIEGKWVKEDVDVVLINVYAPNSVLEQSSFWGPWILGGDFNVVRCRSERSNWLGYEKGSREFVNFNYNCNLIGLP
ncbi:hypothetical protein ES332_A06G230900v1 [Gossypium tomentosum]|uniref:Uncharacterized protein n=1 Tax=Gossypium tomentosum TaxID=34277 RepID=A0A5D2QAW8_GOSTO|nr:hypothetical protein ES332_A06G230900v1 [Gossypium tomentosum]